METSLLMTIMCYNLYVKDHFIITTNLTCIKHNLVLHFISSKNYKYNHD